MDGPTLGVVFSGLSLAGTLVAVAAFWMRMGATETRASSATISIAAVKLDIASLTNQLNDHRVLVARDYASNASLQHLEERIMGAFTDVNKRLDAILIHAKG